MQLEFSTDKARLDRPMIVEYLQKESYWSKERSEATILKAIDHSLCFGAYSDGRQVGFGRAVTDRATAFYLADIFIITELQGKGLGQKFFQYILQHPELQGLRGMLTTQTAHSFYRKFDFETDHPIVTERMMVLVRNGRKTDG